MVMENVFTLCGGHTAQHRDEVLELPHETYIILCKLPMSLQRFCRGERIFCKQERRTKCSRQWPRVKANFFLALGSALREPGSETTRRYHHLHRTLHRDNRGFF